MTPGHPVVSSPGLQSHWNRELNFELCVHGRTGVHPVLFWGFILVGPIWSHCAADELGGKTSPTLPLYFNLPNEVTACPIILSKTSN